MKMAEDKETEQKIAQLQMYEQSLQNILLQKQQLQSQITEIESALKGLENSSESYKIIGNIMVKENSADLKKELEEKKSTQELRVKSIEKQENLIREKFEKLQSDVMKKMQERD
jgi:prefoldin beta subunit